MDSTHTCSSEVLTQSPLPVEWIQSDLMGLFLFYLVTQPFLEEARTQVQSLTYMDDIYLIGAPDKMPGVISSLQQKNLGSVSLNSTLATSPGIQGNA